MTNVNHTAPQPLGPLMLDLEGVELSAPERELIANPLVGAIIFFSRNISSREQIIELVEAIRAVRPDILLAVDQEGGRVQRFRNGFTRLPPMQRFAQLHQQSPLSALSHCRETGWLMAAEVLACGVDMSFAPVLDVDDAHCAVIADRSFSPDPDLCGSLAGAFIDGMHDAGMATTGKHFPGHGGVSGDSHLVLPVDERSWEEIAARDWKPFVKLRQSLDGIMPAHILFPKIDSQPVGYSRLWLQQKLRGELQFEGVIFSDDLSMAGAVGAGDYAQRAELALNAGCDMVLVCNDRPGALQVLAHLETLNISLNPRLARMRQRRSWNWDALEQSPRRAAIREFLASITGDPNGE